MAKHSVALSSYGLKFSYEVMKELKQPQGTSPDSLQGLLSTALRTIGYLQQVVLMPATCYLQNLK